MKFKQHNAHLPIQSSPVLSSELPMEHKHTKDPWLFLQSPLTQGLDWHSSTSVGDKNKQQISFFSRWSFLINLKNRRHSTCFDKVTLYCTTESIWVNERVSDPRRRLSQDQTDILWDTDRWNCLVCFCTDRFHTGACSSDTHQYLRKNTDRERHNDFPFTGCIHIYFEYIVYKEDKANKEQLTYRHSFCPSGLSQSLHCRCICMSSSYSHTPHSGRCQGRGRTR